MSGYSRLKLNGRQATPAAQGPIEGPALCNSKRVWRIMEYG